MASDPAGKRLRRLRHATPVSDAAGGLVDCCGTAKGQVGEVADADNTRHPPYQMGQESEKLESPIGDMAVARSNMEGVSVEPSRCLHEASSPEKPSVEAAVGILVEASASDTMSGQQVDSNNVQQLGCGQASCSSTTLEEFPKTEARLSNDFCEVCQKVGKLLLCDRCPRAFHTWCAERLMDFGGCGNDLEWLCPVCRNGPGALLSREPVIQFEQEGLQAQVEDAASHDRRQARFAAQRRNMFLLQHLDMIRPFSTQRTLQKLQQLAADNKAAPLRIGARVKCVGPRRRHRCKSSEEFTVLVQLGASRYLVANESNHLRRALDGKDMALIDGSTSGHIVDFWNHLQAPALSEGTRLKDYQVHGVNWLINSFLNCGGGILADDMGLGKTIQALATLSCLRSLGIARSPFLIVAPLTCVGNWMREVKRFVPHLSVAKICGGSRERQYSLNSHEVLHNTKDIIITTYESMTSGDGDYFQSNFWSVIVLDEAHRIKNRETEVHKALSSVNCAGRFLLTGTPLQNHLGELYTLLSFLWQDVLDPDSDVFEKALQQPDVASLNPQAIPTQSVEGTLQEYSAIDPTLVKPVQALLSVMLLRRLKEEVISLPPKVVRDVWLPLSHCQISWYKALLKCRSQVQQKGIRALLQLVLRLRLLSCHPRCLALSEKNRQELATWKCISKDMLKDVSTSVGNRMNEQHVLESNKFVFVDKLLTQLHGQNMAMVPEWKASFEDRQRKMRQKVPSRNEPECSSSLDATFLFEEMHDWQPRQSSTDAKDISAAPTENGTLRPHKVLIFTQFHACLDLLQALCASRGWRSLRLDGSINRVVRELDMRDFNSANDDCFVYLIGTRAGGLGVNLATANHVVLFDQDWNPYVDLQAIDRAHRLGQNRIVNIYRLMHEWSIEERLAQRQEQKLKMEQCVMPRDNPQDEGGEGLPAVTSDDRISAKEVMILLQYGEHVLQHFDGEDIHALSLRQLLARKHRALSELGGAILEGASEDPVASEEDINIADVEGECCQSSSLNETIHAEVANSEKGKARQQEQVAVRRSSSGRILRPPKNIYTPPPPTVRKMRKPLSHEKHCFACGTGCRIAAENRDSMSTDASEVLTLDRFCAVCPKAYHSSCVRVAEKESSSARWICDWHICRQCERRPSACGGMLLHCIHCPTAFCHDCFPPDFLRVHAPDEFWEDLNHRGWPVTAQKMMLFECNACRMLEAQRIRHHMPQGHLEKQQNELKQTDQKQKTLLTALANGRKQIGQGEQYHLRMKKLSVRQESFQLRAQLLRAQMELLLAAEQLWPSIFRAKWLECMRSEVCEGAQESQLQAMVVQPRGWKASICAAVDVCANCKLPGHWRRNCPFPSEVLYSLREDGLARKNQRCPICKRIGHPRMQCVGLDAEERRKYQDRLAIFCTLSSSLLKETRIEEPCTPTSNQDDGAAGDVPLAELAGAWKTVSNGVQERVRDIIHKCGLEDLLATPRSARLRRKTKVVSSRPSLDMQRLRKMGMLSRAIHKFRLHARSGHRAQSGQVQPPRKRRKVGDSAQCVGTMWTHAMVANGEAARSGVAEGVLVNSSEQSAPVPPPAHWPPGISVAKRLAPWVPDEWGQGQKLTSSGKACAVWISPEGRVLYHKADIEKLLERKLEDMRQSLVGVAVEHRPPTSWPPWLPHDWTIGTRLQGDRVSQRRSYFAPDGRSYWNREQVSAALQYDAHVPSTAESRVEAVEDRIQPKEEAPASGRESQRSGAKRRRRESTVVKKPHTSMAGSSGAAIVGCYPPVTKMKISLSRPDEWVECPGECGFWNVGTLGHNYCCNKCSKKPGRHGKRCKRMPIVGGRKARDESEVGEHAQVEACMSDGCIPENRGAPM